MVRSITKQAVSDADLLNRATRSYLASFSCEASRDWKPDTTAWSEWRPTGFAYFPSVITIEEKNGILVATANDKLAKFTPGPEPSLMDKNTPAKNDGLPPGMTRMK